MADINEGENKKKNWMKSPKEDWKEENLEIETTEVSGQKKKKLRKRVLWGTVAAVILAVAVLSRLFATKSLPQVRWWRPVLALSNRPLRAAGP